MTRLLLAGVMGLSIVSGGALAHGDAHPKKSERKSTKKIEETEFGREGDLQKVARTVEIAGSDDMRYTPSEIRVLQGETVRFVFKNTGKMAHEAVLGTLKELSEHYQLMERFPGMEHDEPHIVHVKAGATGSMVWQFTRAGEFPFACLIAGHWDAGMHGKVIVTRASEKR